MTRGIPRKGKRVPGHSLTKIPTRNRSWPLDSLAPANGKQGQNPKEHSPDENDTPGSDWPIICPCLFLIWDLRPKSSLLYTLLKIMGLTLAHRQLSTGKPLISTSTMLKPCPHRSKDQQRPLSAQRPSPRAEEMWELTVLSHHSPRGKSPKEGNEISTLGQHDRLVVSACLPLWSIHPGQGPGERGAVITK